MKKSKIALMTLFLTSLSINALAEDSEYNVDSKILTIPAVKIGSGFVYDATLKLNDAGSFDIIGYSDQPATSSGSIDAVCTPEHVTLDIFNQITDEMTKEQVDNLIGCEGELLTAGSSISIFRWIGGGAALKPLIQVSFGERGVVSQNFQP